LKRDVFGCGRISGFVNKINKSRNQQTAQATTFENAPQNPPFLGSSGDLGFGRGAMVGIIFRFRFFTRPVFAKLKARSRL
jgi:hypothetical protein